jgi:hypothetical protein
VLTTQNTLYLKKLTLTSTTSGGCSVGIVLSRTQDTEFVLFFVCSRSYVKYLKLNIIFVVIKSNICSFELKIITYLMLLYNNTYIVGLFI